MKCGECRRKVAEMCLDSNGVCATCRSRGNGNTNPTRGHYGQRHGERPVDVVRPRLEDLVLLNALLGQQKGGNP